MYLNSILNKVISTTTVTALFILTTYPVNSAVSPTNEFELLNIDHTKLIERIVPQSVVEEPMVFAFSSGATSQIIAPLRASISECRSIGAEYRASCAAEAYRNAARAASRPDYAPARAELNKTARALDKLVAQNADKSAPPLKSKSRTYRAVKKAEVAKVNKQAVAIIAETETKLLRSSGSGTRQVHYQQIAQAVGSTKVIFRS